MATPPVKRRRPGLAAALMVAVVVVAGCSGSSGNGDEGNRTVETGSTKTFCQSAAELASALQAESWTAGVPVERALAKTFEALDNVANSAPEDIKRDADSLRSGLERVYSSLDDVPAVGDPPDPALQQQAEAALQKSREALTATTPALEAIVRYVQGNCQGTTFPTVAVPAPPSS